MRLLGVCVANGAEDPGLCEQFADRVVELVGQLLPAPGGEAREVVALEVVALEVLPEPPDGIETRAVGGKKPRLDVVPVEGPGLVPAGVVQDQDDALFSPSPAGTSPAMVSGKAWNTSVSFVRDDEAGQLAVRGVDRCGHVLPDRAAVVGPGGPGPALHPALAGRGSPSKPASSPKKRFHPGVGEQIDEFTGECLALLGSRVLCPAARARAGGWAWRNPARGVAHEGGIGKAGVAVLAQPSAKFDRGPVVLPGWRGIVDNRECLLPDRFRREVPRTARAGAVGVALNAGAVEATDPLPKAALADAAVGEGGFKGAAAKQEMDGVEPFPGFLVLTAGDGGAQFLHGAVLRIGKLTRAADASSRQMFKKVQARISVFTHVILRNGSPDTGLLVVKAYCHRFSNASQSEEEAAI